MKPNPDVTDKTRANLILFALWLLIFSASSQIIIIAPILPVIGEQLSMPESLQGVLVTSYAVMVGIFALVIGPISDKVGRRRVLLVGTTMFATTYLVWRYVPQPDVIFNRSPIAVAGSIRNYIHLLKVPKIRAATGSFFMTFISVGLFVVYFPTWMQQTYAVDGTFIASLFFAGVLFTLYGYGSNTILSGFTILAAGLLIWKYVPESTHFRKKQVLMRQQNRKQGITEP